nr:MAG TPA: hypothetical protein [Caudoviricetes sp.]
MNDLRNLIGGSRFFSFISFQKNLYQIDSEVLQGG